MHNRENLPAPGPGRHEIAPLRGLAAHTRKNAPGRLPAAGGAPALYFRFASGSGAAW